MSCFSLSHVVFVTSILMINKGLRNDKEFYATACRVWRRHSMLPNCSYSQGVTLRELRFALLVFIAVLAAAGISYFLAMHMGGSVSISSDNQDWGGLARILVEF